MNTTQKRNLQAKAAGGYIVLPEISKNKIAEVYYRRAMTDEIERMLSSMFRAIERAYTTIPVQNAKMSDAERLTRLRRLLERLRRQYGAKLDKNAERIIKKYLNKAQSGISDSLLRNMRKIQGDGFTINFDSRKYGRVLKIRAALNAELIKNTTSQIVSNVTNVVYDGVTTGQSWHRVEQDLRSQKRIAADRIKRIARDQTAKLNENLNEMAMRDAGVEFFEWSTARDERVSTGYGGHKQLDGKIYKWGDNANYPVIDTYGHRGVPGQRVNCFTGDIKPDFLFPIEKLYKRHYSGNINVICFDGHSTVRATPNHPFLTEKGWVAANNLKSGDNIVCIEPVSVCPDNVYNRNVSFRQIFKALQLLGFVAGTVTGRRHQFHGDGIVNKKVNVIDIDSLLRSHGISAFDKSLRKFSLAKADMRIKTSYFTMLGILYTFLYRAGTTNSLMGFRREFLQVLRTHLAKTNEISRRAIADLNSVIMQNLYNLSTADRKLFRKSQTAFAFKVKRAYRIFGQIIYSRWIRSDFNTSFLKGSKSSVSGNTVFFTNYSDRVTCKVVIKKVLRNRTGKFSGHVYNLQCVGGLYTINNGVVNHNCRCTARPVLLQKDYQARQTSDGDWVITKGRL